MTPISYQNMLDSQDIIFTEEQMDRTFVSECPTARDLLGNNASDSRRYRQNNHFSDQDPGSFDDCSENEDRQLRNEDPYGEEEEDSDPEGYPKKAKSAGEKYCRPDEGAKH